MLICMVPQCSTYFWYIVSNSAAMLPKVRSNLPPENVNSGTAQTREGVRERGLDQLAIIEQKQDKSYLALCVVNQTVFWGYRA